MSTVHTETISVANKAMPSEMEKGENVEANPVYGRVKWTTGQACSGGAQ